MKGRPVEVKVFISWSRLYSHAIAEALHEWLPLVIQGAMPFVSSVDIHAGTRWQAEVSVELECSNFGLVCVTAENQREPWLNFEAGALSKAVQASRVVPIAVDLKATEIVHPLAQFQSQPLTLDGMLKVSESINSAMATPLNVEVFRKSVRKWWPDLESKVAEAREQFGTSHNPTDLPDARSNRDVLDEILGTVRGLAQAQSAQPAGRPDWIVWDNRSEAGSGRANPLAELSASELVKTTNGSLGNRRGVTQYLNRRFSEYGVNSVVISEGNAEDRIPVEVVTEKMPPTVLRSATRKVLDVAGWDLSFTEA